MISYLCMKKEEPTIKDVLEEISVFADNTEKRFMKIESQMATKDYLDDKLGNLRGEMIELIRKLCPWGFEKQPIK